MDTHEASHIDELVFAYQDGDAQAGEEILRLFGAHPDDGLRMLPGKTYHLLRHGRMDYSDKQMRWLISTYMQEGVSQHMTPFYQYHETKAAARRTIDYLNTRLRRAVTDEQLAQDLRLALLKKASLYQKSRKRVWFPGYLKTTYLMTVKHMIDPYINGRDWYTNDRWQAVRYDDEAMHDPAADMPLPEEVPMMTRDLDDELGNAWFRGISCGAVFASLTPLERRILKWNYVDRLSDRIIAERVGMHRNTVTRTRHRARQAVAAEARRYHLEEKTDPVSALRQHDDLHHDASPHV